MGGALLQQVNRDTQKFAMKCSSATVDGIEVDVFKDPITDDGKRSKAGRLDLVKVREYNGATHLQTVVLRDRAIAHPFTEMRTVFLNGESMAADTFEDVRL